MTKYPEILRLAALNLSQQNIADSCSVSKKRSLVYLNAQKN
jgi:hypothetical protein